MAYLLPRDAFLLLEEAFNHDRAKAEVFAHAIETSISAIQDKANEYIVDKKDALKSELYNELRYELATKEFVRAEINGLRDEVHQEMNRLHAEMKQQGLLLKILIGLAIFGLTLFNPAFVKLVELLMK
ncbi:MAG: hypothetical protein PHH59_06850 [Methylovulum sp.]|uniref:hypothetical protein n=1 Tax=Methylovulum sp. TaxID=1916980 RepID=UPI002608FC93|nr:hypothetical protein [Methylovulum sp.]MDD2723725.1 hypothetical protein [Methylovulum sp.]MDD5123301.1 hypothetical protein [Methylovulum sp.]